MCMCVCVFVCVGVNLVIAIVSDTDPKLLIGYRKLAVACYPLVTKGSHRVSRPISPDLFFLFHPIYS